MMPRRKELSFSIPVTLLVRLSSGASPPLVSNRNLLIRSATLFLSAFHDDLGYSTDVLFCRAATDRSTHSTT
jgi:hypothetical protein